MSQDKIITLTDSQKNVLDALLDFVKSKTERVFILNGYAGTGKTTLMRFFVNELNKQKKTTQMLAPTGRAAKVLCNLSGNPADTIHSLIYKFSSLNKDLSSYDNNDLTIEKTGQLFLDFKPTKLDEATVEPTIYIIDEASMISDIEENNIVQAKFGSGKLLTELLNYDKRPESKFIFIGDPCQLPPIHGDTSPALIPLYIQKTFNLDVTERSLTEIMRQASNSDLITVSLLLRQRYATAPANASWYGKQCLWGRFPLRTCRDLVLHTDLDAMVSDYIDMIKAHGYNSSVFIAPSNKKAYQLSTSIRQKLGFSSTISVGDLLMVVQNNYPTGLMNGDMVEVMKIGQQRTSKAGLTFVQVSVKELFSGIQYDSLLLESVVNQETVNLDSFQQTQLFIEFVIRCKNRGIKVNNDNPKYREEFMKDPYLNALRCSYGYAITCHKAQGGEWQHVYIDFGQLAKNPTKSSYQWAYTAVTRARQKIHTLDKPYIGY